LGSLAPVTPFENNRYILHPGHVYSLQMASGNVAAGGFSLDTQFFSSTNDSFSGGTHLEGTNLTFIGNFSQATFEAGEPNPGATNTIWASWVAPFTGRARYTFATTPSRQYVALYTGPTLDHLQPVRVIDMGNGRLDFLAVGGTVYHFQF